jgi:hypothetical protein
LKPGQYSIKLDGSKVMLKDSEGRQIDTTAKVETADRKFEQTSVVVSTKDGVTRIGSKDLGGSNERVVFQ